MDRRNFVYRIYPTKKQIIRLEKTLSLCTLMYNILLNEGVLNFAIDGFVPNAIELKGKVTQIKNKRPELKSAYAQVLQECANRVSRALNNYDKRIKEKNQGLREIAGKPRYKKMVKSFTHPQAGFRLIGERRIEVCKIGKIPIVLHRPIEGKIKTMTIVKRSSGHWFAIFSCETQSFTSSVINESKTEVGVDLGIGNIASLSSGEKIPGVLQTKYIEKQIGRKKRRLDKRKYGGMNYNKMKLEFARLHEKVKSKRVDYLHKVTRNLVNSYSTIALETIRVQDIEKKSILSKSIGQSCWYTFTKMLEYKAASAGSQVIFCEECIPTSQECSRCGRLTKHSLFERIYRCPHCELIMDRDINAAVNILKHAKARAGHARSHARGDWTSTILLELRVRSLSQELHVEQYSSEKTIVGLDATSSEFQS
jgi:putative transposase